jgi:hypothetical protein
VGVRDSTEADFLATVIALEMSLDQELLLDGYSCFWISKLLYFGFPNFILKENIY